MIRKVGFILVLFASFITHTAYSAIQQHNFVPGLTLEYELPSNEPQTFSNPFFWTLKASCRIISDNNDAESLNINLIKNSGIINGIEHSEGDSWELKIKDGEVIKITAFSGTKVQLTNQGQNTIKASCSSGH